MLDVGRLDTIVCTTPLEVKLLAALVRERRLRSRHAPILRIEKPQPKPQPKAEPALPVINLAELRREQELRVAHGSTVRQILREVARVWGVSWEEITTPRRQAFLVEPRHVICMLARTLTGKSYPEIGRRLGGRDHTSILHGAGSMNWLRLRLMDELSVTDPLELWVRRAHEIIQSTKPPAPQEAAHDQGDTQVDADVLAGVSGGHGPSERG